MILPFDSELFGYKVGKISLSEGSFSPENYIEASNAFDLIYIFTSSKAVQESFGDPISTRVEWEKDLSEESDPIDLPPDLSFDILGNIVDKKEGSALERLVLTWWGNLLAGKHTVLLARRSKEILGLITLRFNKKKAHVDLFAIMPENQGRGLGKLLLQKAMQLAGKKGMEAMALATQSNNTKTMKLYRSAGFERQRETMIYHWRPQHTAPVPNAH
jgi:dTDP-4-amino-4,6-dideoxy-D-galactose acyltransferase